MRRSARDAGAATVAALALMGALTMAGLVALAVGQQAAAREQLSTAADIAALAAAQAMTDPCAAAEASARANSVRMVACATDGPDFVVTLTRPPAPLTVRLLGWLGHEAEELVMVARAGPPG